MRAGSHLGPVSAQMACKERIRMQTTRDKLVMIWNVDQSPPEYLEATLGKERDPRMTDMFLLPSGLGHQNTQQKWFS